MHKIKFDGIIRSLILIKIGQDLGTNNEITRAIHRFIEILNNIVSTL